MDPSKNLNYSDIYYMDFLGDKRGQSLLILGSKEENQRSDSNKQM